LVNVFAQQLNRGAENKALEHDGPKINSGKEKVQQPLIAEVCIHFELNCGTSPRTM